MIISTNDHSCLVNQVYSFNAGEKRVKRIGLSGPCDFVVECCYFYLKAKEMSIAYEAARKEAISEGKDPNTVKAALYDPLLVFSEIWENPEALRKLGDLEGANPYEYMIRFNCEGNRTEKGWVIDLSPKTHSSGRGDRMMTVEFVDDNSKVIGTAQVDYSTSLQHGFCDEFRE